MHFLDRILSRARADPRAIVFAEGDDPRIREAARRVGEAGIARPLLVSAAPESADRLPRLRPEGSPRLAHYVERYARRRTLSESAARRLLRRPLYFAAAAVEAGDADGMVAGAAHTTAALLTAAGLVIGPEDDRRQPFSFFIMALREPLDGREALLFADCAVNIEPDEEQLAYIGMRSAASARALLEVEPRVAFLSFSTYGSAAHVRAERVRRAMQRARDLDPACLYDGEMQADAALVPRVAALKAPRSPLAGRANVLVFPDLDSANIGYKLVERLAGARAVGPVLVGYRRPVNDLSRGATVEDMVAVTAITVVQAQQGGPG